MKARFLFFLYFFPPAPGTAPKRNFSIARAISEKSTKSIIFTAPYPGKEVPQIEGMEIRKVPVMDYRFWLRSKTKDGYLPEHAKKQKWKQWGIRLINSFPVNIIAGEGGIVYFINLVTRGHKAIRQNEITHIYSSFRPFTDHYAAYILKSRNPKVKWIADFRDLIIDENYRHILLPGVHNIFFKRMFAKADLLTTVSEGLAQHLRKYNPEVRTLRNGIEHIPLESIEPVHCKYFKIVYTGSLMLDTRNAEPIFRAVMELINERIIERDEVRIIYAGKDGYYWKKMASKFDLETVLIDKGIISNKESLGVQQNACINILLTISTDQLQGVLTGKMIEYFVAGVPILGIVVNQNDPELNRILTQLEIGKSYSDRESDFVHIKNFILSEFIHWKKNGTNRKPVNLHMLREKYSIQKTMQPLFDWVATHP